MQLQRMAFEAFMVRRVEGFLRHLQPGSSPHDDPAQRERMLALWRFLYQLLYCGTRDGPACSIHNVDA